MAEKSTALQRHSYGTRQSPTAAPQGGAHATALSKDAGTEATAQYIADLLLELRNMARGANLPHLAYFLEMAFYEAFNQAHKGK